jgi:mannitol 2-dehydrogenase
MRDKLLSQDCLTTLIELDPQSSAVEVVGSMIDYLPVEEGNRPLIARMAEQDIRIVSLTVTESGYYLDSATGGFDTAHPDIVHDSQNPDNPKTVFGAIVAALRRRRDAGIGPFTALSCDNLQGNGDVLRRTVVSLAWLSDAELADWIDANCTFPNSMVDCIVPATGPKEIARVRDLGIEDAAPVTHENFRQWVIEDSFCAGRPPWEKVGATFSDKVHDYEVMKIRILNAGHQIIAAPAVLLGVESISECMQHPTISQLFLKIARAEIVPHVKPVPDITPADYTDLIFERFSNPLIVDTTRRVAYDGSTRHPGFLLPTIRDALANGTPLDGLALVEAAWARTCAGTRDDGSVIEPNDSQWDMLNAMARAARTDPTAWLTMQAIYGDLAHEERFAKAFANWLSVIWEDGIEVAVERYCTMVS